MEIQTLDNKIHETVDTINTMKTQREFYLSFSKDPQLFINKWLISQSRGKLFLLSNTYSINLNPSLVLKLLYFSLELKISLPLKWKNWLNWRKVGKPGFNPRTEKQTFHSLSTLMRLEMRWKKILLNINDSDWFLRNVSCYWTKCIKYQDRLNN